MANLERPADQDHYAEAFKAATGALREAQVPFALFGSTALWGMAGRKPRTTEDIDLIIAPDAAEAAATALDAAGFDVERPPEGWLLKGWHRADEDAPETEPDILVDLIFEPEGVDAARALAHAREASVAGMHVPVVSATDLLASKALTLGPASLDAQSAVEFARLLREQVDWDEFERRVAPNPYARALLFLLRELGIAR